MRVRLAIAIVLTMAAGCSGGPEPGGWAASGRDAPSAGALETSAAVAQFDSAVLREVNLARAAHGRRALRADPRLTQAAAEHAGNMAALETHSHRLPVRGQRRLAERLQRQGVSYRVAGENIGMEKVFRLAGRPIALRSEGCRFTYADTREAVPPHTVESLAEAAVARWMASPKHRASLLRRDFRRTGSGFGIDPDGLACGDVYLAQTFAD
jgi:uncharacterized protein YkwD